MTDWRFYLATLHVTILPVSRAGAVEVSLTPTNMAWYFGFLETYVFPFILAASVALLIGYGIMRVFEKAPKDDDVYARIGPAHDPELPVIDVPDEAPDGDRNAEPNLAPDEQSELSRALRSTVESATPVAAPTDAGSLLARISARATEQEQAGRTLDLENLGNDAETLENTDELVRRISARVTEQVMELAEEAGGMPVDNAEAANKLDALLQRIGARSSEATDEVRDEATDEAAEEVVDEAAASAESTDRVAVEVRQDDGLTPAERLDALLARINAPAPDTAAPAEEPVASAPADAAEPATEEPSSDRLNSLIERIGARAAGKSVEEVEVAPVGIAPADDDEDTTAERLEDLMKRVRVGAAEDTASGDVDGDSQETLAASDEPAMEAVDAEPSEPEPLEDTAPVAPVISDADLPDLEIDSAMDDAYAQRIEPTFAPYAAEEDSPSEEEAPEQPTETEGDVPIDIVLEGPVESVMDMSLDVDETAFDEETVFAPDDVGLDAALPLESEAEPAGDAAAEPPVAAADEAAADADGGFEPLPEPGAEAFDDALPAAMVDDASDDATVEPAAASFDADAETGETEEVAPPPEESPAVAEATPRGSKVGELMKRIGARVAQASDEEPAGPQAELLKRISARVPDEPDATPDGTAAEDSPAEQRTETREDADTAAEDVDDIEKPILERLIDRDRKQDAAERPARETDVPDAVRFSPNELLMDRVHSTPEPEPEPVAASRNDSDVADTPLPVDADAARDYDHPIGGEPEPVAHAGAALAPDMAAGMAGRIVSDLDTASAALERVGGIVEGYESAREGLDLAALGGMRLAGFGLPQDAETSLRRLGEDLPGAAMAGFAAIDRFNHVLDQLSEMAQDEPLDEGWNELLQDRVQETILAVGDVSARLREVAMDEADTEHGAAGGARHGRDASATGISAGGE